MYTLSSIYISSSSLAAGVSLGETISDAAKNATTVEQVKKYDFHEQKSAASK
jgi:hypothetical protein